MVVYTQRACLKCNAPYTPKAHNQKYCTHACLRVAYGWNAVPQSRACKACGTGFESGRKGQRFCSADCRARSYHQSDTRVNLAAGTAGALAELTACADLLSLGWEVYRNVSPHGKRDLVIAKGHLVRSVEVRTAHRNPSGTVYYNRKASDCCDHYALFFRDTRSVVYEPPLPQGSLRDALPPPDAPIDG